MNFNMKHNETNIQNQVNKFNDSWCIFLHFEYISYKIFILDTIIM